MTTVLITGANRGIGFELARQYKATGAHVIAAVRKSNAELDALGVRVEGGVELHEDSLGGLPTRLGDARIDILIANAGVLRAENLNDLDVDSIRHQMEINAIAPLKLVAAVRKNLNDGARIGLITSRMGSIADNTSGGMYGYRMSKAALNMAGVSLAHDLKRNRISVAILHPGFVRTEMTRGNGNCEPADAAAGLIQRIDNLTLENSGTFWHANGEILPW